MGPNGETVGIVPTDQALKLAQEADLDLVEIAPQGKPPVCKLMDYGKFKYENAQKAREARRNQTNVVIKEMKLRPKIDQHDYETKKGHVVRFLKAGDKVKITIMFRGREQHRPELGFRLLQRLAEDVTELGFVESAPKQDGRNMIMVLGPHKKKAEAKVEQKAAKEERMAERAAEAAEEAAERATARAAGPVARRRSAAAPRTWTRRSRRDASARLPQGLTTHHHTPYTTAGTTYEEKHMPKNKTHSGASKRFKVTGDREDPSAAGGPEVRRCVRVGAHHREPQEAPPQRRDGRAGEGRRQAREEAAGSLTRPDPTITRSNKTWHASSGQ